jgi:prepilin-type N-terminal cleavage/methylation domain-containing protein
MADNDSKARPSKTQGVPPRTGSLPPGEQSEMTIMHKRKGFTLVEMLVAMALTMFVMAILSEAFVTSLETFSVLKAVGDLEENTRTAAMNIRDDLRQDHFGSFPFKRRLSDPWGLNNRAVEGFFALSYPASTSEGVDGDSLPSYQAINHEMNFTVKMNGNRRENFMTARVNPAKSSMGPPAVTGSPFYWGDPNYANTSGYATDPPPDQTYGETPPAVGQWNGLYTGQWGEIHYGLEQTGSVVEPNNPSSTYTPKLYALYRCQYVLVPDNTQVNTKNEPTTYLTNSPYYYHQLGCKPDTTTPNKLYFSSPKDVTTAGNRTAPTRNTYRTAAGPRGGALLLTNVISFHIRVMTDPSGTGNWDWNDPATGGSFDTATSTSSGIRAIEITIRTWDMKTQQSRQVTIVQDM